MAKKKYTFDYLREHPEKLDELTTPQLQDLYEKAKEALKSFGGLVDTTLSPADFAHKVSAGKWEKARHLVMLSDWLFELDLGKRERLLVMMPPRHGKSECISRWYPFWFLSRHPDKRVMFISATQELADKYGRLVRNAVIEHGDQYGLKLDGTSMAAARWDLVTGGGMNAFGAHSVVVGRGADLLVCDDIIGGREDADSEVMREKLWGWWQTEVWTRREPGAKTVVLGTRWHEDDLMGRLVNQHEEKQLKWDILRFPTFAEESDQLKREVGEVLWPERWSAEAMEEARNGMVPYNWSALHQQRPSPEEGGVIKRTWFKWYQERPSEFDSMIQSWDLGVKDAAANDFWVGQIWGRKGAEFYLLHQIRAHMDLPECLSAMRNISMQFPQATAKVIEDKAAGPGVIQMLNKEIFGMIPWPPKGRQQMNKTQRLNAQIPKIEAGNVYLPLGVPWTADFVEECAGFPNARFDDQVDAMVFALDYLGRGGWSYVSRAHRDALGKPEPTSVEEIQTQEFSGWVKKRLKKDAKERNRRMRTFRLGA
jgi:predicted phage terminase large subunit-like protein